MDPKALFKARSRLRVAHDAIVRLSQARSHEEFADIWYTVLSASKNVWTALEGGAKGNPQSMQWLGGKKRERRGDELLQYMFEARNDDEHGLEPGVEVATVTRRQTESFNLPNGTKKVAFSIDKDTMAITMLFHTASGATIRQPLETIEEEVLPPRPMLMPVKVWDGKSLEPPSRHLGRIIGSEGDLPEEVARLNLTYLERLVTEAEGLS